MVDLFPGLRPRLKEPHSSIEPRSDGRTGIRLSYGRDEDKEWAIQRFLETHPEFTREQIDAAIANGAPSQRVSEYMNSPLRLKVKLGSPEYFRAISKAVMNLLAATHPAAAANTCFDRFRTFVATAQGDLSTFVRFWGTLPVPEVGTMGPHDHYILIYSDGMSVRGTVQLFGGVLHSLCLCNEYKGDAIKASYQVDPHREHNPAEVRGGISLTAALPRFEEHPPYLDDASRQALQSAVAGAVQRALDRQHRDEMVAIMERLWREEEAVSRANGQPIDKARVIGRIAEKLAEYYISRTV